MAKTLEEMTPKELIDELIAEDDALISVDTPIKQAVRKLKPEQMCEAGSAFACEHRANVTDWRRDAKKLLPGF